MVIGNLECFQHFTREKLNHRWNSIKVTFIKESIYTIRIRNE